MCQPGKAAAGGQAVNTPRGENICDFLKSSSAYCATSSFATS